MIPLVIIACSVYLVLTPSLDRVNRIALPLIIVYLIISLLLVYRNLHIRTFEVTSLLVYAFYHFISVFRLLEHLAIGQIHVYLLWSPLFLILSFLVLSTRNAFIFAFVYLAGMFFISFPIHGLGGDIPQFWISQVVYMVFLIFYKQVAKGYLKAEVWRHYAFEDTLTGITNRRGLETFLEKEFDMNIPLSIIFLDIDYFKQVNDKWGHEVGDNILIEFSNLVAKEIPEGCQFGRWGGEEFLIICKNKSPEDTKELAERIRIAVEKHPFKDVGNITISSGISYAIKDDSPRMLIWRADAALYEAKLNGRNNVKIQLPAVYSSID